MPGADVRVDFQTMLDEYTDEGYSQVTWDGDDWPELPDEIFAPTS